MGGDARINAAFADKIKPQRVTVIIKKKGKRLRSPTNFNLFPLSKRKMGNQQKPISNGNERSIDTAEKEKKKI